MGLGRSVFIINRFGKDCVTQRLVYDHSNDIIILMTASLSVNFDPLLYSFLIGYIGIRLLTSMQYYGLVGGRVDLADEQRFYLGYVFLIGITVSS